MDLGWGSELTGLFAVHPNMVIGAHGAVFHLTGRPQMAVDFACPVYVQELLRCHFLGAHHKHTRVH